MRVYVLEVSPATERTYTREVVRDDEHAWGKLVNYLERLQFAGVIDDWEANEVEPVVWTAPSVLNELMHAYDDDLEAKEAGYEESSSGGGDDPGYRSAMQDAGRGALL